MQAIKKVNLFMVFTIWSYLVCSKKTCQAQSYCQKCKDYCILFILTNNFHCFVVTNKPAQSMYRLLLIGFLLQLFGAATAQENSYNLVPFPAQFNGRDGQFRFSANTKIVVPTADAPAKAAAQILAGQLNAASGLGIQLGVSNPKITKDPQVFIGTNKKLNLGEEGYKLSVLPTGVRLEAATGKGLFYGVQTILQLLPVEVFSPTKIENMTWAMPVCDIQDKPRFGYRGLMLDVGRHFMPVATVKKFIDLLAMHKMNTFHWHLTQDQGWRIEIKKYPELTQIGAVRAQTTVGHYDENYPMQFDGKSYGGFYTQDQIRDVVKYAQGKFVAIIPEIEMPGHARAALAAYPELSCDPAKTYTVAEQWGIFEEVYCPTEQTFKFLEDVLTEVFALFPGKYIHIGGDECPKEAWEKSAFCRELIAKNNLKDANGLQSYFVKRIEKFVNAKGRSIIGWDEILEGGLAPNATVMSWRGTAGGIEAAKQRHKVVMSPTDYCYLDYYQGNPATEPLAIGNYLPIEKVYAFEPVPAELPETDHKYIWGVQANLWTEYVATPEQAEYMAFPRAVALAEVGWMPRGPKNFEDFALRLRAHLKRLDYLNVNYAKRFFDITASTQVSDLGQIQVNLKKIDADSKLFYTTDGKEPSPQSAEYLMPIQLKKTTTIKAITTSGGRLEQTFYIHRAKGKAYNYTVLPYEGSDTGSKKLTDGVVGSSPRSRDEWAGFYGTDMDVTIDLGEVMSVTKVSCNLLKIIMDNGFPPTQVEVAISKDGKDFKEAIAQPINYPLEGKWEVLSAVADFKTARARYVRVRARNAGPCPVGHPNAGEKTWFAVDEIVVE